MHRLPQWATLDRNDLLIMVLNYPVLVLANYLLLGERYFRDGGLLVRATLVATALYVMLSTLLDFGMKYLRQVYPHIGQSTRRIVLSVSFYAVLTAGFVWLLVAVFEALGFQPDWAVVRWILLVGFASNVLSAGIHEAIYSHRRWQESIVNELKLRDLAQRQQLDVLKQQINPHFLFNSLNILDALIDDEPAQARQFLEELASVYRYLLRANRATDREQPLTPLAAELDFIRSYFHLLKTRYGHGLHLDLRVGERFQDHQLPPLTLQLLVENAVKHNVVLPEEPLTIEILTEENGHLVVQNNLQRRPQRVRSNGVGLTNILAQYQLLGQPAPAISDDGGRFAVVLPLVEPFPQPHA